ncbi:MAG: hypothetical protein ABL921_33750, partial [Pirellula sp.]
MPTFGHGTRVTIGCTKVAERCVLTMERSLRRLGDPLVIRAVGLNRFAKGIQSRFALVVFDCSACFLA